MSEICWNPGPDQVEKANLNAFARFVNERYGLAFGPVLEDYQQIYDWSVTDRARFWEAVWRFCGIKASRKWDQVLAEGGQAISAGDGVHADDGMDADQNRMLGARWFTGARLNFAENLLRYRDDREAIVFLGEGGVKARLTFRELYGKTERLTRALEGAGIQAGDRAAGFMPNIPETVIAMLAAASLGAIWSSCSPDFGIEGVVDRFGQIEPRILFAADGYRYGGKRIDSLERVRGILHRLPSIEKVVVVPYAGPTEEAGSDGAVRSEPDLDGLRNAQRFEDFLGSEPIPAAAPETPFVQLPFDHPLYIMYSSGTTGLPKCMVHSAGGTLIQHLKEHVLHCDITREDRVFYFTTCGWMMWNWLVSALASGATVMLYDGSPFHPPGVLWDFAAEERITVFGTSAKYLSAMEKEGLAPARTHDLSALKSILSTGSPLAPESFDYVYRDVKADLRLSSISGGTDIISCFALGSPVLPVVRGELQCRGLGMKVEIFDHGGRSVVGEKGELVCTAAFPSMPIRFWNDPDGSRYRAAYFEDHPGVWSHGDYAELRPGGGVVIYGRSDAVLNPGGVRIGTAEIYRVVEQFDEVKESIAVGQEWKGDVRIILFVHLKEGVELDDSLKDRIRAAIRKEESPRHVPAKIIKIGAIPRTLSGKIVEIAVREVIHGRPVKNADALANPEALDLYRDLPELRPDVSP